MAGLLTTLSIPRMGLLLALVLEGLGVGWSGGVAVTGRQGTNVLRAEKVEQIRANTCAGLGRTSETNLCLLVSHAAFPPRGRTSGAEWGRAAFA